MLRLRLQGYWRVAWMVRVEWHNTAATNAKGQLQARNTSDGGGGLEIVRCDGLEQPQQLRKLRPVLLAMLVLPAPYRRSINVSSYLAKIHGVDPELRVADVLQPFMLRTGVPRCKGSVLEVVFDSDMSTAMLDLSEPAAPLLLAPTACK